MAKGQSWSATWRREGIGDFLPGSKHPRCVGCAPAGAVWPGRSPRPVAGNWRESKNRKTSPSSGSRSGVEWPLPSPYLAPTRERLAKGRRKDDYGAPPPYAPATATLRSPPECLTAYGGRAVQRFFQPRRTRPPGYRRKSLPGRNLWWPAHRKAIFWSRGDAGRRRGRRTRKPHCSIVAHSPRNELRSLFSPCYLAFGKIIKCSIWHSNFPFLRNSFPVFLENVPVSGI